MAAIARAGVTDSPTGFMWMTITGPGVEELPWDRARCKHGPEVKCSGRDHGCQAQRGPVARWNGSAMQRWSWFMTYLRREVERQYGPGVKVEFFKVWETQERGVLHIHAMLRISAPVSRRWLRQRAQSAAIQQGFGRQFDVQHISSQAAGEVARKAGYLAKYATKEADDPAPATRIDRVTGEVLRVGYRPWSSSRGWGESMRSIRAAQYRWATSGGLRAVAPPTAAGAGGALDTNGGIYTAAQQSEAVEPGFVGASAV